MYFTIQISSMSRYCYNSERKGTMSNNFPARSIYSMANFYVPESVMAIVAHPDDIEFSCAGTIARWVKAGARAAYVLCTGG